MNELELTGIDGTRFLGFRAALGLIRLSPTGSTIFWNSTTPVLTTPSSEAELIESLVNYAQSMSLPFKEGRTDGFTADEWRDLCRRFRDDLTMTSWLAGLGSDLSSAKAGKEVKKSVFDLTAANQSWVKKQLSYSKSIDFERLKEALFGPWLEADHFHHMGWDLDLQLFSTSHHDLATRLDTKCTLGAVWLANESLPLQPVWLGENAGTPKQWALWNEPLNRWEVQSLIMHGQPDGPYRVNAKSAGGKFSAFASANP